MSWHDNFVTVCKELESSMNRLTAILTYEKSMPDDEKLVILSIFEAVGSIFSAFGNVVTTGDEDLIAKALDELREIQLRMSFIIDKHPLIESLSH